MAVPASNPHSAYHPNTATDGRFRWVRLLFFPVRFVGRWLLYLPRFVQIGVVLILVGGTVVGGYYGTKILNQRARDRELGGGWRDFGDAALAADVEGMRSALDRVLAVAPDDALALKRKASLATLTSAPDDPDFALVLLNMHTGANRLPEAAREAERVLTKYPNDWRAKCVLAHHALVVQKDRARAEHWLGQLPAPESPGARLDAGGLLYALRLHDALGRDAAELRSVVVLRLLPALRGGAAREAPAVAKVQFVECYLAAFADPKPKLDELVEYWAVMARLADAATTEAVEAGDVHTLLRIGEQTEPCRLALVALTDAGHIPPADHPGLVKELEDRMRKAYQAVLAKDPSRFESYRGLAILAAREKNIPAAAEFVLRGLTACGNRPELLDLLVPLAAASGGRDEVLGVATKIAAGAENDPIKWCLAANAYLAGERADLAMQACESARRIVPNHPWATQTLARLWLRAGEPGKAIDLLRPLGEPALRSDPVLARLHARALVESGLDVLLDGEFAGIEAAQAEAKSPAVLLGFVRGAFDAQPHPSRLVPIAVWVADKADTVRIRFADDPAARRLYADALYRRTESGTPAWSPDLTRTTLRAYDGLPAAARSDPDVITATAALQLRGLKDSGAALRTIAPLRGEEAEGLLTMTNREIMAAVFTANNRPAEAIRLLEPVTRLPNAPPVCWIQLALAYHANRQPHEAKQALKRAESLPCSDHERQAVVAAKKMFQGESP